VQSGVTAGVSVAGTEGTYTEAHLEGVEDSLDQESAIILGRGWYVDSALGRVVVSYDDGVRGDRMTALKTPWLYGDALGLSI
jgi:hypothetical protein